MAKLEDDRVAMVEEIVRLVDQLLEHPDMPVRMATYSAIQRIMVSPRIVWKVYLGEEGNVTSKGN